MSLELPPPVLGVVSMVGINPISSAARGTIHADDHLYRDSTRAIQESAVG